MKEKKGLNRFIRLEAVIPVLTVILIVGLYFTFFFDSHLRKGLEWGLTKALGAEVNIGSFQTKVSDLSLKIENLQITDSAAPHQNVLQIGEIRFSALWDGLLRAKIVVNEAVIEKVEFGTPRNKPGYVAPPPPPEEADQGPSAVEKAKDQALSTVEKKFNNNVIGDAASWLSDPNRDPLEGIQADLVSKALIEKFQKEVEAKKSSWEKRLSSLPKPKEFEDLGQRLSKVKTSNFKNPNEITSSLKELDSIFKEADKKYKEVNSANQDLNEDLKKIELEVKSLQNQVQQDLQDLEKRLKIPKLDAQSLAMSMFSSYLGPYQDKFFRYKKLADQYMPPNLKKKGGDQPDESLQPRPRARGVSYEFGRPRSYPALWIKKTRISSQAGLSPYSGNIEGEIRHISTNQLLTGEPIVAEVKGDFPAAQIQGLKTKLVLDNRKTESHIHFDFLIDSYPVQTPKDLVKSPDLELTLMKSMGRLDLKAELIALKDFELVLNSDLNQFEFTTQSKQKIIKEIFDNALKGIPQINITAKAKATLPNFPLSIDSNLGREISKAFEAELKAQVEKAKKALQDKVNAELSKNKEALTQQINELKTQIQGQLDKLKSQADSQKKQAESQMKSTQKEGQKKVGKDAEKALKKLFGR